MPIENFAEVQEYLTANNVEGNEVKTYMDSLKVEPTLEVFKGLASTNVDFKSYMDSEKDKHSAKGLETWKINNLGKAVDDEVNKRFPKADPKDVEFAKYKAEQEKTTAATNATIAKMIADSAHKDLTNKALQYASEKKLPADLVGYFIGADQETTDKNLEKLMATMTAHDEAIKLEFAKGNSYTPPAGGTTLTGDEKIRADIAKWMK
ncbi:MULTISPECIES: DUF4355 domain-containing protein [Clostridium]|uniref:DUF4355 domain-containing protein n=1 Tax=Clostridium frigoriphilum TaxID=443253 RepID=A0ABU7UJ71_9CLOT|nr:DUF4355 domain-containing protein [Clostridium sp. DSM 17811]MBU3098378.1 DUF4355 domain-containing protein [Clostridium sp. DSM 17811]